MALLRMIIIRQIFIFLCNVETMGEINKPHDQGRTHQNALTMPHVGTRQVALQRSFSLLHSQAHDPDAMHILPAAMLLSRSPMASSLSCDASVSFTHGKQSPANAQNDPLPSSSLLPTPHLTSRL